MEIDPAPAHEKKLNSALNRMLKKPANSAGKAKKTEELILTRKDLKQFITEGAISPQLKGNLKIHKEINHFERSLMQQNHQDMSSQKLSIKSSNHIQEEQKQRSKEEKI